MNTEIQMLPEQPIKIDEIVEYNGNKYQAVQHFSKGTEARSSGIKIFINTPRGIMGMKEV